MLRFRPALPPFIALACLGALAPARSQTAPPPAQTAGASERDTLFAQAEALQTAKRWPEAEAVWSRAIALDPAAWGGWINRGYVRSEQGNFAGAVADTSSGLAAHALAGGPNHDRAIMFGNRSYYWLKIGEPRRALIDAIIACEFDPQYSGAWLNRAQAQYALGNLEQARICMEKTKSSGTRDAHPYTDEGARQNALKNKPLDEKADMTPLFDAAFKADKDGKTEEAIAGYSAVIERNPLISNAWGNRGALLVRVGRLDEAIADDTVAISLAGISKQPVDAARLLANRSIIYTQQGRVAEAVNDLRLAAISDPNNKRVPGLLKVAQDTLAMSSLSPLEQAARLLGKVKDFKGVLGATDPDVIRATSLLDTLIKAGSKDPQVYYLRGVAEERAGSIMTGYHRKALPYYLWAISLRPDDPATGLAYYRRGAIRLGGTSGNVPDKTERDKEHKEGLSDLDKAVDLGVKDAGLFAERASWRAEAGNTTGAKSDLDYALFLEPQATEVLRQRANLLQRMKLWRQAAGDWSALLATDPKPVYEWRQRAACYVALSEWPAALSDLGGCIAAQPDDPDNYLDRARAYRLKGDRDKALADYAKARALDDDYPPVAADLSNAAAAEAVRESEAHSKHRFAKAADAFKKSSAKMERLLVQQSILGERMQRLLNGDTRTDAQKMAEATAHIEGEVADREDYTDRASLYLSDNKYALAIADCTTALSPALAPAAGSETDRDRRNAATAYDLRGRARDAQKQYLAALADMQAARKNDPDNADYAVDEAIVRYHQGDYDGAIVACDQALKISTIAPNAGVIRASAFDARGLGKEKKGDLAAALADYQAAGKGVPADPRFALHEGNAHLNLHHYDEAIAAYDLVLKLQPDNADATANRALAVKAKGK